MAKSVDHDQMWNSCVSDLVSDPCGTCVVYSPVRTMTVYRDSNKVQIL